MGSNARFRAPAHAKHWSLQAGAVPLLVRGYFLQCTGFCSLAWGRAALQVQMEGPSQACHPTKQASTFYTFGKQVMQV